MLEILYQDDYFIAINKPAGLLVHRTSIAAEVKEFALQKLRKQIGQKVYPVHRLDRPTSGVLMFTLSGNYAKLFQDLMQSGKVEKKYLALVRGFPNPREGSVDSPLKSENRRKLLEAKTIYKTLAELELPYPYLKYPATRIALLEMQPLTGRTHQLRRHCNHCSFPIVGDRKHGDLRFNRHINELFPYQNLQLLAREMNFVHPISNEPISIVAKPSEDMLQLCAKLNFNI